MLTKIKPHVERKWLLLVSGLLWSGVGVFLNSLTWKWLQVYGMQTAVYAHITGIAMGITISVFGFSKIADKNVRRIHSLPERVSIFAFQEGRSYLLIAFMMSLGIFIRRSGYIPKNLLAPMYIGIGVALFLTSFLYYRNFINYSPLRERN
jgi:CBS domain containing-hemolysin-like protein